MQRSFSGSPYEQMFGFCRALRLRDRILIAGTAPIPSPGGLVATGAHDQMMRCGSIVREALEGLGSTMDQVVRTRVYITDPKDAEDVGRAHATLFGGHPPVATMVIVAGLLDPAWKVEFEAEAEIHESVERAEGPRSQTTL